MRRLWAAVAAVVLSAGTAVYVSADSAPDVDVGHVEVQPGEGWLAIAGRVTGLPPGAERSEFALAMAAANGETLQSTLHPGRVLVYTLESATTTTSTTSTTTTSTSTTTSTTTTTSSTTTTSTTEVAPQEFPDESNTGVPAGVTLTPYTGPTSIQTPGTVINGKLIDDCIQISAPGVVIRNSLITCPSTPILILDDNNTMNQTPMLIEDSEIDCEGSHGSGIAEANFVARRVEIRGCENGLSINQNVVLEDSFIHDVYNGDGAHSDGVQLANGHWNGSDYECCALDITVRHNAIYAIDPDGDYGSSAMTSNRDPDENILIENNILAGGSYTLYCVQFGDTGINYRVIDNRFVPGAFGYSTDCSDEVQSGNVDHETGEPITLD